MGIVREPVLPVASALLAMMTDVFDSSDAPLCRVAFGFGERPPADSCCDCSDFAVAAPKRSGSGWVRVGHNYPSTAFPAAAELPEMGCSSLAASFTLGVYRCAPTVAEQGRAPSPDDLAAALDRQLQDAQLLRVVAERALSDEHDDSLGLLYMLGTWAPIEPRGGCMGGSLTITAQLAGC